MFRTVLTFFFALSLAGCARKSGEAIVVEKEHIDKKAAEVSPSATPGPESSPQQEPVTREMTLTRLMLMVSS